MVIESADPETGIVTILRWAFILEVWREDFDFGRIGFRRSRLVWPLLCGRYQSDFVYGTAEAAQVACQITERRQARQDYPDALDGGVQFSSFPGCVMIVSLSTTSLVMLKPQSRNLKIPRTMKISLSLLLVVQALGRGVIMGGRLHGELRVFENIDSG